MSVSEDAAAARALPLATGLALIFDLDGVVVDSMPVHAVAWQRYLHSLGVPGNNVETRMHGRRNDEIVRDFLGPEVDPQTVFEHGAAKERLFRDMMRGQLDRYLVPGATVFLRRARVLPVALATNAEPANVDFVLDGAGLRSCFRAIVDGTQVARAKPAPDVYLRAAEKLGVDPSNCIVFEDSPVGVEAARAAGARVAGVLTHARALEGVDFAITDFLDPGACSMVVGSARHLILPALLMAALAQAQELQTLEEVTSRAGRDFIAAYEGRTVTVRAQVAANPIAAVGTYYLPVRDGTEHGLILRGGLEQFAGLEPGDWIEAAGSIQSRGGMPLLEPSAILKIRHESPPEPKELTVADLYGYRYLGLLVRTEGTAISGVNENLGGTSFEIGDRGSNVVVFLPRDTSASRQALSRLRAGDRVRLTGLATQYSLEPPHDRAFQLILPSPENLEVLETASTLPPVLLLSGVGFIALLLAVWWIRERRMGAQRQSMRVFHALSEEIISSASPSEIAEKLATELPTVTRVTSVRLYLYSRRTKSLERVPTSADPQPVAVPIEVPPGGLASGAAACFRNRTLLNVPDVRRSPFVKVDTKTNLPRSAMFVPLLAQNDVLGVLEVSNSRRSGYFTLEEQATTQHLANQVAASLKLQQQQTMREQLFRGEKLAATGQLISGVASDLRAPLETIVQLSTSLSLYRGRAVPESDLRQLAGEAQRAAEIVSRLVSFARPEDSGERHVDVNALVSSLMKFREPEWRTLGLRIQNRLAPEHAPVLGVQGQLEQVFLNLLVHAEQSASEAPGKTIAVSSSVIARRIIVEIGYSVQAAAPTLDPFSQGLAVCQGIVQSHGGEIRFRVRSGTARFEVDLPVASPAEEIHIDKTGKSASGLTLMLVDSDEGGQRQLLGLLGARGHRAVPATPEEAADLAQRLRFDAVIWAIRPANSRWSEFHDRIRNHVPVFVLLNDLYDPELARTLEENGSHLLSRPIQEADLDRILKKIEAVGRAVMPASPLSRGPSF